MKGKILVFFDANDDEVNANVRDVHDYLKNPQNNGKLWYWATVTKFGTKHSCEKGIQVFQGEIITKKREYIDETNLLQNHWTNFNQIWHNACLVEGD